VYLVGTHNGLPFSLRRCAPTAKYIDEKEKERERERERERGRDISVDVLGTGEVAALVDARLYSEMDEREREREIQRERTAFTLQ
jgi:hypothetical protein